MAAAGGATVFRGADGRPVDVGALFDARGRRVAADALLADFAGGVHFTDARGGRVPALADAAGRPVAVAGAAQSRAAFDGDGRPVVQTVFREADGRPLFVPPFAQPTVFDSGGCPLRQRALLDEEGRPYVCGSLAAPPRESTFFDENGRPLVLAFEGRASLFQFCDCDGRLMERKAVFDHNGQLVGWILLDFENSPDRLPRAIFAAFPEGAGEMRAQAWRSDYEWAPAEDADPLAALSPSARKSFLKIGRIMPLVLPWSRAAASTPGAIYDLTRMRIIARLAGKRVRRVGTARPLGDVALAIKVFRPRVLPPLK
jgi:hypothetical protein